jgi:hypothetical protein
VCRFLDIDPSSKWLGAIPQGGPLLRGQTNPGYLMAMVRATIGFYDTIEEAQKAIRLGLADESILAEPEPRIGEWPDGRFIVLGTMEFTEPKTPQMLSGEWDW